MMEKFPGDLADVDEWSEDEEGVSFLDDFNANPGLVTNQVIEALNSFIPDGCEIVKAESTGHIDFGVFCKYKGQEFWALTHVIGYGLDEVKRFLASDIEDTVANIDNGSWLGYGQPPIEEGFQPPPINLSDADEWAEENVPLCPVIEYDEYVSVPIKEGFQPPPDDLEDNDEWSEDEDDEATCEVGDLVDDSGFGLAVIQYAALEILGYVYGPLQHLSVTNADRVLQRISERSGYAGTVLSRYSEIEPDISFTELDKAAIEVGVVSGSSRSDYTMQGLVKKMSGTGLDSACNKIYQHRFGRPLAKVTGADVKLTR